MYTDIDTDIIIYDFIYINSPDSKFLAVSLLDSTVKVFFADTLKVMY
jgi:hypothetical protein